MSILFECVSCGAGWDFAAEPSTCSCTTDDHWHLMVLGNRRMEFRTTVSLPDLSEYDPGP